MAKVNWKSVAVPLLLVALTAAAYLPVVHCGFIWDDDDYIIRNETLRDAAGLWRMWFELGAVPQYYPLVHTTFWLEYHLWGLSPLGYHLVNVGCHALAAILLWRLVGALGLPGGWLAAAIFATHPVCVESVAWVTERKNVLSAVFYLGAALAYLRFGALRDGAETGAGESGRRRRQWQWYLAAFGLFGLAMLSKTVACSLPAALLLVQWWRQGRLRLKAIWPLAPFFALGIGLGLVTVHVERHFVGASGADWALTLAQRCLVAGRAVWFYAGKLVFPWHLTFIYPRWDPQPGVWWQWLFPAGAVGVVVALWAVRRRIGRGPLVAALFFGGTLLPALGFVNVYPMRYSFVADHFQYLAAVGLIVLFAAWAARLLKGGQIWLLILPMVLGALTWQQIRAYRSLETLWRDTLAKNPGCWLAHNNLGVVLEQQGKLDQAEAEFRRALELKPTFAEALNSLGGHLAGRGRVEEGISYCRRALEINPIYVNALYNLGNAYAGQQRFAEAISYYEEALRLKPRDYEARSNLAQSLAKTGRMDEALAQYRLAWKSKPEDVNLCRNLAAALVRQGKPDEAIGLYRQALGQNPNDANLRYELGLALALQERWDEAIEQYTETLRLASDNVEARYNLGYALRRRGRLEEAAAQLREALRLAPEFPLAQYNLGCVLADQGRRDEAVSHLKEAVRLKPDYHEAREKLRALGAPLPQ
jgi:protein O-mannosyl-transferase